MNAPTGSVYTPSDWGLEYHGRDEEEVLGAGSAGPGKSLVLLHDADAQILTEHERCEKRDHPYHIEWGRSEGRALHLRRTFGMLEETLVRAHVHFREMDPGVRWDLDSHTFVFASGYRYKFGHCKDATSWSQYLSQQYSWIGFDELVQFNEEQYDNIITRLRSGDRVLRAMLKIRSMSNPLVQRDGENFTVRDPNWVRRRFVEPAPRGRVVLKHKLVEPRSGEFLGWNRLLYLPATLDDNPDPEFVASYKRRLVNAPAHIRDALLYGNWFLTQNSYFGDVWNPEVHICRPFKIPDYWRRFRSMDWGFKTPGVVHWWAIDDEDTLYCEKEYTFKGLMDVEVARRIREIERDLGLWDDRAKKSRITGPADTQLWERRGDSGKSKIVVFLENGVPWTQADKNKRSAASGQGGGRRHNAQLMSKRLRDYDVRRGKPPGLVFFDTCKEIIKAIPTIIAEDADPETPVDWDDDHWFDSACYAVAYASHGPHGVAALRRKRELFDDDDARFKKRKVNSKRRSYDGQF